MVKLLDIKRFLDETFAGLAPQDFSNNGLQLDAGVADVRKMAFAVDACQKTFDMAAANGRHIDTILKVAKIFDVPVDIICR